MLSRFHGCSVETTDNAADGVVKCEAWRPDVVLLDLDIPVLNGQSPLERIRTWSAVPVIALSTQVDEQAKVTALNRGADDYLTRPFGTDELAARIRVAIRHLTAPASTATKRIGDVTLDFGRRRVSVHDRDIRLRSIEYDILKYLAIDAGRVLTHRELLEKVWGPSFTDQVGYLRPIISSLRRKLGPEVIQTQPGVGYRLRQP